jgi:hypothetical protein
MSNHTGGDERVAKNDLKKSSIVLRPDKDIFILESPHCKQAFSVLFTSYPASRCLEFSNHLMPALISPRPFIFFKNHNGPVTASVV